MDKFDVVAAIIIKDDKYFIAQRNRNKHMGLSWEFPGGKVEEGESFEIALKREIEEELNIEINIKNKLGEENYQDDKINVKLHYFICSHANKTRLGLQKMNLKIIILLKEIVIL